MDFVIFCGGVHGVGKTSLFKELAPALNLVHLTASELIRAEKASAIQDTNKVVKDIKNNQDLLTRSFERVYSLSKNPILLDGHFTLQIANGGIQNIPIETFNSLRLTSIILIEDFPALIRDRLLKRDGIAPAVDKIEAHQEKEKQAANIVATQMSIPICITNVNDREKILDFIKLQ